MPGMYETNLVLKKQEVGNTIFIAESEKVPFSRLLRRGKKPVQMLSQWPLQIYPDRKFTGTLDGTDIAAFTHTTREYAEAYAMWLMTEGWMVSKLAGLTKTAGVENEESKQAKDDGLILAQMIEKQLLSDCDTAVEAGSTPFRSRGAFSWIQPGAQSVKPVPTNFRPASASQYTGAVASFGPANMRTMLKSAATAKKGPVDLTGYVGIDLKDQMSTWAQRDPDAEADEAASLVNYNINASEKKLIHSVNFFDFDAGTVKTFPSWYLMCTEADGVASAYTPKSGLFLDMDMWELCFLQNPMAVIEPTKSGGPRGYHDACYLLKGLNMLGQCSVLSNS